jgi:hypothetical protein
LRLKKLGQSIPDDEFFKKHPSYNSRVLDGLMSILQLLGSTGDPTFDEESYDPSEVITIIRSTNINAMECFCVLCLKHIVGTASWRQKFRKDTVSNAFTISDEAFAFLVLDNNRVFWKLCYIEGEHNIPAIESMSASGRSHKRRKIETKYTKRGSSGGKQGWNQEGIDTYNSFLKVVMNNRNKGDSKDLEERLRNQWNNDRMNHLQSTGRVLNDEEETYERHDDQEADIVDIW